MNILTLPMDTNLTLMIQEVLEMEGHTVIVIKRAVEAISIFEDGRNSQSFLLLADNIQTSQEARMLLSKLAERPELRRRVRMIAEGAIGNLPAFQEMFGDVIDDYLAMPFTVARLLDCIEMNAARLIE